MSISVLALFRHNTDVMVYSTWQVRGSCSGLKEHCRLCDEVLNYQYPSGQLCGQCQMTTCCRAYINTHYAPLQLSTVSDF